MTTSYQCAGCKLVFSGADPLPMGDTGVIIFPQCPKAEIACEGFFKANLSLQSLQQELEAVENAHVVGLAIVVTAPVMAVPVSSSPTPIAPKWGPKTLVLKAETPEERAASEAAAEIAKIERARQKAIDEVDGDARRLVDRMQREMAAGGGTVSSKFPYDLQYGTKDTGNPMKQSLDVIVAASGKWTALGAGYRYRAPAFKQVWGVYMANFEMDKTGGGQHNYHVIPS